MAKKYTYHDYPADERLLELMTEYRTYAAIARTLNMTAPGLIKHIKARHGLKVQMDSVATLNRHFYPDPDELFVLMRELGSYRAVAEKIGCSRQALEAHAARTHIKPRMDEVARERNRVYPTDDELYEAMRRLRSLKHVALEFDIPLRSFWSFLYARPDLKARLDEFNRMNISEEEQRSNRRAWEKQWRARNPHIMRARAFRGSAKQRGGEPDKETVAYAGFILKDPCSYCGQKSSCVDHIEPLAHGGGASWENLTPACTSCNSRKRTKSLLNFMLSGFHSKGRNLP